MYKLFVFVVVALLASSAMSSRIKRQSDTTTTSSSTSTPQTEITPEIQQCITGCPATPEYNPVCGTNRVAYPNPGRLFCAQSCGVNVSLLRSGPCPTITRWKNQKQLCCCQGHGSKYHDLPENRRKVGDITKTPALEDWSGNIKETKGSLMFPDQSCATHMYLFRVVGLWTMGSLNIR